MLVFASKRQNGWKIWIWSNYKTLVKTGELEVKRLVGSEVWTKFSLLVVFIISNPALMVTNLQKAFPKRWGDYIQRKNASFWQRWCNKSNSTCGRVWNEWKSIIQQTFFKLHSIHDNKPGWQNWSNINQSNLTSHETEEIKLHIRVEDFL